MCIYIYYAECDEYPVILIPSPSNVELLTARTTTQVLTYTTNCTKSKLYFDRNSMLRYLDKYINYAPLI